MTEQGVIENKISSIQKYLKILANYSKITKKEILANLDKRGAVERYLYLLTQSTIDLAEAVISLKGLRKPSTMGESFTILAEEGIISRELSEELIKMVGFRNILAHEYEEIDYDILYGVLTERVKSIEEFVSILASRRK